MVLASIFTDRLWLAELGHCDGHTKHKPLYLESQKALGIYFLFSHEATVEPLQRKSRVQRLKHNVEVFRVRLRSRSSSYETNDRQNQDYVLDASDRLVQFRLRQVE